jgi:ubiquinone/menaquinone biosynthesis C-methylase UbiE
MILTSDQEAIQRFDSPESAAKYAAALPGTNADRREQRALKLALAGVPAGATVLDLPSGTGRLLRLLSCVLGYNVTEADSSPHMLQLARQHATWQNLNMPAENFCVADVMKTPFADGAFDAIVCNRLFHHFREPAVRRQALVELGRISKGLIIVSFFRSPTWGALAFSLKYALRGQKPTDRIPISLSTFQADIHAAGLRIVKTISVRPVISKSCYVVLERQK